MVHGDNSGLVLPPRIAPTQVMVIPIQMQKEGVMAKAQEVKEALAASGLRVKLDDTEKSPGWKFSEQEMRGIPVRIELGPKVSEVLETMQREMLERARAHRDAHTYTATDLAQFKDIAENKPGFIRAMWCGCQECEDAIKDELSVTSRCMPFAQEKLADTCIWCGKPAKTMVYWGKAY